MDEESNNSSQKKCEKTIGKDARIILRYFSLMLYCQKVKKKKKVCWENR